MMKPRAASWLLPAVALLGIAGCGTIVNFSEGPHPYGGVRNMGRYHDLAANTLCWWDLPCSFALDTGILPLTLLAELSRWIAGWPPPSPRLYPDPHAAVKARIAEAKRDLAVLESALGLYKIYGGAYPTPEEGLKKLYLKPHAVPDRWDGRFLIGDGPPRDPWGKAYVYRSPGRARPGAYDLFSSGPDGLPDTADDVVDE